MTSKPEITTTGKPSLGEEGIVDENSDYTHNRAVSVSVRQHAAGRDSGHGICDILCRQKESGHFADIEPN